MWDGGYGKTVPLLRSQANWIRELLNGFSLETDMEVKVKTRQRLRHLVNLENKVG